MARLTHLLAGALLLASAAAPAAGSAPSVQMSKLVLKPSATASQKIKVGEICLFAGQRLDFGSRERTLNFERYERLFAQTMTAEHFSVIAKSSNLFDDPDAGEKADYLIGATLSPTSVTLCDSDKGQKGSITVAVEWQLYDRAAHRVVETISTEGTGDVVKFSRDGLDEMVDKAFIASLEVLISKPAIHKYLGAPAA